MIRQWYTIIIILALGFFLSPTVSYACGTKTEKSCCAKGINSKDERKKCCCDKHSKDKKNNCEGKCGRNNCTTSSLNFSVLTFVEIEIKNNNFDFSTEKQNFYYTKTNLSSGFYFIWLPPVIS